MISEIQKLWKEVLVMLRKGNRRLFLWASAILVTVSIVVLQGGYAEANIRLLAGVWRMADGTGTVSSGGVDYPIEAHGEVIVRIDNINESERTLDLWEEIRYRLFIDGQPAPQEDEDHTLNPPITVLYSESEIRANEYTLSGGFYERVIKLKSANTAEFTVNGYFLGNPGGNPGWCSGYLTFQAYRGSGGIFPYPDPDPFPYPSEPSEPSEPDEPGGVTNCNAGIGLGLILALGAALVLKRTGRKARKTQ